MKKFLFVALTAVIVISCVSCSRNNTKDTENTDMMSHVENVSTAEETPTTKASGTPVVTDGETAEADTTNETAYSTDKTEEDEGEYYSLIDTEFFTVKAKGGMGFKYEVKTENCKPFGYVLHFHEKETGEKVFSLKTLWHEGEYSVSDTEVLLGKLSVTRLGWFDFVLERDFLDQKAPETWQKAYRYSDEIIKNIEFAEGVELQK